MPVEEYCSCTSLETVEAYQEYFDLASELTDKRTTSA